jgi:hypothetical protein
MYAGADTETHLETRIKMNNKQKTKSSKSILPDESSMNEHIKRSDLQAFIWYQCLEPNIEYPAITDRGWTRTAEGIPPVWYTCLTLPPSLSKKKQGKRQKKGNF